MHPRAILIVIAALLALPAISAETGWAELAPDVQMRLISSNALDEQGVMWAGLEIDMPAETKTYWRVPGESGIPLVLIDTGSEDIASFDIAWPFPARETDRGYLDHSFYGWTLIPVSIQPQSDSGSLDIEVTLGICSDICIPATARFDLDFDLGTPDTSHGFRIRQALAEVPQVIEADDLIGEARFDTDEKILRVDWLDTSADPGSVIAELDGTLAVFDVPSLSADETMLEFPLLGHIPSEQFESAFMRFSYRDDREAFETTRQLIVD